MNLIGDSCRLLMSQLGSRLLAQAEPLTATLTVQSCQKHIDKMRPLRTKCVAKFILIRPIRVLFSKQMFLAQFYSRTSMTSFVFEYVHKTLNYLLLGD